ncbi:MAG TPA: ABC transporter ATP-binding protein [Casimicrobiaceae bacterium]|nr:ABC transporter ATP-binding protein [Casimicrobiaceae bacterium]
MSHAIELDAVTLARGGRVVLSQVDATIRMGEFVGVFGPNGAGKTTLLHAILGLLQPLAGAVRVLGQDVARGQSHCGYLPQQRESLADLRIRAWDFVASAVDGERWGLPWLGRAGAVEVDRVIALVEADALASRRLSELSGGELQRLRLAQALIGKPKLLLLDEPLASLDPRFQHSIVALVKRIQSTEGVTVLFTAHDPNPLLGAMDRVLYLGRQRAALGSVDEVMTSDVLSRLYDVPIDVLRVNGRIVIVASDGTVEPRPECRHA